MRKPVSMAGFLIGAGFELTTRILFKQNSKPVVRASRSYAQKLASSIISARSPANHPPRGTKVKTDPRGRFLLW